MPENNLETLIEETVAVKKLLMLQLLATGYKQKHLAATLGVSEATLSRMLPRGLPDLAASAER
jgi:DNA-binding transcriptional regulator LsrR (DeoR family)